MRVYSQELQDSGINLLAIINMSTYPILDSVPEEWSRTVTEIVTSLGFNNTDAVEICNEPNGDAFIVPEIFREMLKSAHTVIKKYTSIPIIFPGLSPDSTASGYNWSTYLNAVFAHNDTHDYFDYMGIHLYGDMEKNLNILQFVKNLTAKPVWITETGETSFNKGEAAQADYLRSVYSSLASQVSKIFIYELKDNHGLFPERENHFGLLTANGSKKDVYYAVWEIGRK